MNYIIISDSSSDLMALQNANYTTVPLKISTDEKEFVDNKNLNVAEMVSYLKNYKGKSKSSCPNVQEWKDAFADYDTIFCVTITSNLSGSYNSAKLALDEHLHEHPEKQGLVIDTLSAGAEIALIIEKLYELINNGLTFKQIKNKITEYQNTTHLLFRLDSLTNLANNGRVSSAVAKIAGLLGIRIIGKASLQGTLEMLSKARGKDKPTLEIIKQMKNSGYTGGKVRIHHCLNCQGATELQNEIKKIYPTANIVIQETMGLCSFYAEEGGLLVGYEGSKKQ